jgi:large subunit ribosomal protein L31
MQMRETIGIYAIIVGFAKSAPQAPPQRPWLSHRPQGKIMKEGIHPNYRDVLFVDLSNGFKFVTRSCVNTKEMGKTDDGRELPLFKLDTSSESHPFYTGTQKSVDNMGGRVEKFRNRFGKTAAK